MRHYSLYFACAIFTVTTGNFCPAALSEAQKAAETKPSAAVESALGSQGDPGGLGSTPTLRGLNSQNNGSVSNAPGADAMMTQDLLLVNPNKSGQPPQPLQSFVGQTLKISVEHSRINFRKLAGVKITVFNDTNRPLVIDGKEAKAMVGTKTYQNVSLPVLQKKVLPSNSLEANAGRFVTDVVPATVSVGGTPTVEDYIRMEKPIRRRYGSDQRRRTTEAGRFGERILWPHQETQGILYFQTDEDLSQAKIQIPAHTLFDAPDKAILEGS
jgi:hypothetical protein